MSDVNYGEVKRFIVKNGKRFGFLYRCDANGIRIAGAEQVYFDLRGARVADTANGEVTFGEKLRFDGREYDALPYPQKGQLVVFNSREEEKGQCAFEWSFADRWNEAQRELDFRPMIALVCDRLVNDRDMSRRMWIGTDVLELSVLFPKHWVIEPATGTYAILDELTDLSELHQGVHRSYYFQEQCSDGSWKVIDDPRVYSYEVPDSMFAQLAE